MRSSGFWVLLATILGSSLVFIDGAVVSVALPVIQTELHASAGDAQWIIEGYTLVLGALMLLCGALADRYGRKRIFILGVGIFGLGSLCCALAPSIELLLSARILQGIGGTMLAPASLALLGSHFEGEARGKAVGTWSALTAVAATVGPVAGGVIVDHFTWRWVFAVNIPLCAAVISVSIVHLREAVDEDARGTLDVLGSFLITAALGGIVYAFIAAGISGWRETRIIAPLVLGMLCLIGFIVVEMRIKNPIMPLRLFRGRTFSGVNLMTLLLYGALSGLFYFLPFVLIRVDHYSPTATGAAMLPFIAFMVALSRSAGALIYRFGAKAMLTIGPLVTGAGFLSFALLHGTAYWTAFFPAIALVGLGMGITVAPLVAAVMESVDAHRIGLASGINNAVSRIAGLLAIAMLGVLLAAGFNAILTHRMDEAHLRSADRARIEAQRAYLAGATLHDVRLERLVLGAYGDAFREVAVACALLAAASGITAAILVEKKPRPAKP